MRGQRTGRKGVCEGTSMVGFGVGGWEGGFRVWGWRGALGGGLEGGC